VLSLKAPASRTTPPDTELFTIRLKVSKATSIDINCIILITDSLDSVRKAVNLSVHSGQAYFLAIYSVLRSFFSSGLSYKIQFWNCPSKAKWFLYQIVYIDVTNTRVAAGRHLVISIDSLCSKNVLLCLDVWRTAFNCSTVQGHPFLTLRGKNCKFL